MNKQLHQLLHKRMDRKEFLKHVAFGFAALTGAAMLVKNLPEAESALVAGGRRQVQGYSSGAYGGTHRSRV